MTCACCLENPFSVLFGRHQIHLWHCLGREEPTQWCSSCVMMTGTEAIARQQNCLHCHRSHVHCINNAGFCREAGITDAIWQMPWRQAWAIGYSILPNFTALLIKVLISNLSRISEQASVEIPSQHNEAIANRRISVTASQPNWRELTCIISEGILCDDLE